MFGGWAGGAGFQEFLKKVKGTSTSNFKLEDTMKTITTNTTNTFLKLAKTQQAPEPPSHNVKASQTNDIPVHMLSEDERPEDDQLPEKRLNRQRRNWWEQTRHLRTCKDEHTDSEASPL